MKLTKSKLKQMIKEEFKATLSEPDQLEADRGGTNPLPWWYKMTDDLLTTTRDVFRQVPPVGKEYMMNCFETYILQWKEEIENLPDDEY